MGGRTNGLSGSLSDELSAAEFGDQRLSKRLGVLVGGLTADPSLSFPRAAGSDAALEGTYRFLRNGAVTPEAILAPHYRATVKRMLGHRATLVVHDTTSFRFGGESPRRGLGRVCSKDQGFFGHFSLAVTADGSRTPLGILNLRTLFRTQPPHGKRSHRSLQSDAQNESRRWLASVDETEARVDGVDIVHVMDREGDAYELLSLLSRRSRRFVVRAAHNRTLAEEGTGAKRKLMQAVSGAEDIVEREVPLTKRGTHRTPLARKHHPPRQYRIARLAFRATSVTLARPQPSRPGLPPAVQLNVVHVHEVDAPTGQPPVCWTLYTSEPIQTADQVLQIVDWYRARWTVEEYFRALKQGCAYESRQLETRKTLLNALAIFTPIAWRLLLLRSIARVDSDAPATRALTPTQVKILVAITRNLPKRPTVRQAMLAIARRGGHVRANGEPGWIVLGRGYHDLLLIEEGWIARENTERSDQS